MADDMELGNIDGDLEGDLDDFELDLDLTEPPPPKDSREAVSRSLKDVSTGIVDSFNDDKLKTAIELTKAAIPDSISSETSVISDAASTAKEEILKASKELKKTGNSTIKAIESVLPEDSKLRSVTSKLKSWISDDENNRSSGPSKSELEQQEIASNISAALGEQQDKSTYEMALKEQIEINRNKSQLDLLAINASNTEKIRKFHFEITNSYYRRSLELQYKSLFISKEQLEVMKNSADIFKNQLESVILNTSLPDILKTRRSERIKYELGQRVRSEITDTIYEDILPGKKISKNITNYVTNKSRKIQDGLSGMTDILDQVSSINDMPGMSKSSLVGDTLGGEIKNVLGSKLRKILEDNPNVKKSIYEFKNNFGDLEGFLRDKADNIDNSKISGKAKHAVISELLEIVSGNNSTNKVNFIKEDLSAARLFDGRAHQSITKIIPGLLSKIYGEIKSIRTKDNTPKNNEIVYSNETESFVSKKEYKSELSNSVKRRGKVTVSSAIDTIQDAIIENSGKRFTSKEAMKLRYNIVNYILKKGRTSLKHLDKPDFYKLFTNNRLLNNVKNGVKKLLDITKNDFMLLDNINYAMLTIRTKSPSLNTIMSDMADSGNMDILKEAGLVKRDKNTGEYIEDSDNKMEFLIKNLSYKERGGLRDDPRDSPKKGSSKSSRSGGGSSKDPAKDEKTEEMDAKEDKSTISDLFKDATNSKLFKDVTESNLAKDASKKFNKAKSTVNEVFKDTKTGKIDIDKVKSIISELFKDVTESNLTKDTSKEFNKVKSAVNELFRDKVTGDVDIEKAKSFMSELFKDVTKSNLAKDASKNIKDKTKDLNKFMSKLFKDVMNSKLYKDAAESKTAKDASKNIKDKTKKFNKAKSTVNELFRDTKTREIDIDKVKSIISELFKDGKTRYKDTIEKLRVITQEEEESLRQAFFDSQEYITGKISSFPEYLRVLGLRLPGDWLTDKISKIKSEYNPSKILNNIKKNTIKKMKSLNSFRKLKLLNKDDEDYLWNVFLDSPEKESGKVTNFDEWLNLQGYRRETISQKINLFKRLRKLDRKVFKTGIKLVGKSIKSVPTVLKYGLKAGMFLPKLALGGLFGGNKTDVFDRDGDGKRDGSWMDRIKAFTNRNKPKDKTKKTNKPKSTNSLLSMIVPAVIGIYKGTGKMLKGILKIPKLLTTLPKMLLGLVKGTVTAASLGGKAVAGVAGIAGSAISSIGGIFNKSKSKSKVKAKTKKSVIANKIIRYLKSFKSVIIKKFGKKAGSKLVVKLTAKLASRLIPVAGTALLLWDAGWVIKYMLSGYSLKSAISKQVLGFDLFGDDIPKDDSGEEIIPDEQVKPKEVNITDTKINTKKVSINKTKLSAINNPNYNSKSNNITPANDIDFAPNKPKVSTKLSKKITKETILKRINIKDANRVDKNQLLGDLVRDEDLVLHTYKDSLGYKTIGVGHLLDKGKGIPLKKIIGVDKDIISKPEAYDVLAYDVNRTAKLIYRSLPWLKDHPESVQRNIINMGFNMGVSGLLKFKNTLRAIKEYDYDKAADGLRNSKWYKQVGYRAQRIVSVFDKLGNKNTYDNGIVTSEPSVFNNPELYKQQTSNINKIVVNKPKVNTEPIVNAKEHIEVAKREVANRKANIATEQHKVSTKQLGKIEESNKVLNSINTLMSKSLDTQIHMADTLDRILDSTISSNKKLDLTQRDQQNIRTHEVSELPQPHISLAKKRYAS